MNARLFQLPVLDGPPPDPHGLPNSELLRLGMVEKYMCLNDPQRLRCVAAQQLETSKTKAGLTMHDFIRRPLVIKRPRFKMRTWAPGYSHAEIIARTN